MSKTFIQYLQHRIEELRKQNTTIHDIRAEELEITLEEWQAQQEEILEAISITQDNLNKARVDCIGSKCIEFADWAGRSWEPVVNGRESETIVYWINTPQCNQKVTSEELYNEYTKEGAETSTEDSSSSK